MIPKWVSYVGDFKASSNFLATKNVISPWGPFIFLDALARSFGQVIFANNPLSGMIIIAGLLVADPVVGCSSIFTATVSVITSAVLKLPRDATCAGLTSFSGVLVGSVVMSLAPLETHDRNYYLLWIGMFLGAILSVYLTSALGNMLGSFNPPLPCLTLPFNVVTYAIFICLKVHEASFAGTTTINENGISNHTNLEWQEALLGTLLSLGQVYAVNDVTASSVMYLALIICSPLLAVMSYVGALIGTMTGCLILNYPGYSMSYIGLLGYNSLLSSAAIGGFFYVFSWRSAISALLCAVFSSLVQVVLQMFLSQYGIPVLTMPFVIATTLFLGVSRQDGNHSLVRPPEISFPEMHLSIAMSPVNERLAPNRTTLQERNSGQEDNYLSEGNYKDPENI